MPRWADRVTEDARQMNRPRGVSKFVCANTGVCLLCGHGLGKQYTKETRKEHQTSPQHTLNFSKYTQAFGDARIAYLEELHKQQVFERQELGRRVAEDPVARKAMMLETLKSVGLHDWLHTQGDLAAAKAAIVDLLISDNTETRDLTQRAVQKHTRCARRLLSHQAATSVLPMDVDGAHTIGSLRARHAFNNICHTIP